MTSTTSDAAAPACPAYADLLDHLRSTAVLGSTGSVLSWDQEVMMPAGGLAQRGDQLAELAKITHQRATDPRVGEWLAACEGGSDCGEDQRVNLRWWRHGYDRATKLPAELVVEMSRATSAGKAAWAGARAASDFSQFAPALERIVALCREEADAYGVPEGGERWDALAEGYEPGMTAASVAAVFEPLRTRLAALIAQLADAPAPPPDAFTRLTLPRDQQEAFVRHVAQAIGFDFDRGRLDVSTHPFCSGTHPGDVRLTTRFADDNMNDALGSTMHECGHGLYEQGLPPEHANTPRGSAVGLSIHESQSRLWENQVGRSASFWRWAHPQLGGFFGDAAAGFDYAAVYGSANRVEAGLIRVEADEATYNLHIMIRFALERALLTGDLAVADLPDAWNQAYRRDLGVTVPDDARGCLQDIHWSMGALGYFPTYTMGNLYSAQLFEAARDALGGAEALDAQFAQGTFAPLLDWLRTHVHAPGRSLTSEALCEKVTGKPLSAEPLLRHLEGKLLPLYGVGA